MSLVEIRSLFRRLDNLYAAGVKDMAREGRPTTCTEGCDACCYDRTFATLPEADLIVDKVAGQGRAAVEELASAARRAMDATGRPGSAGYEEPVACPLLVNRRCSVYAERPMNCRGHFVATPPINCSTRGPIELLVVDDAGALYVETIKRLSSLRVGQIPWEDLNLALLKSATNWLAGHKEAE